MSQAESAVWHSVLALGNLHEQGSLDDEDQRALQHRSGLNHYNKAIAHLTKSTDPESQSAEVVLVSCIVFVCARDVSVGLVSAGTGELAPRVGSFL